MCSTRPGLHTALKHDPLEILELNNPENGIINVAGPVTIVTEANLSMHFILHALSVSLSQMQPQRGAKQYNQ